MTTRYAIVAYSAAVDNTGQPWVVSTHTTLDEAQREYLLKFVLSIDHAVVVLDDGGNYDLESTIKASGRAGLA